jgi:hypothetical protein
MLLSHYSSTHCRQNRSPFNTELMVPAGRKLTTFLAFSLETSYFDA